MYCKNCGRELKDGTRFCDRCGQSVRQGNKNERAAKRDEIEALKKERLNRRKKMAELEAKKAEEKNLRRKQRKALQRNPKFIYIMIIVVLIIISAIVSYTINTYNSNSKSWEAQDNSVALNATAAPTVEPSDASATSAPTQQPLPTVATDAENTDAVNADGYRVFKVNEKTDLPYPTAFSKKSVSGNVLLNLMDSVGGGSIVLKKDKATGMATEMMKEYAQSAGGVISYSRAGDNWYAVTVEKNNFVYHRKCILVNNDAIYYDFQYDKNSASNVQYIEYITYMDTAFTVAQ